jgi:hypothetical protein
MANSRNAKEISEKDIWAAEQEYSRHRTEALIDEWKFVYRDLRTWIDKFASAPFVLNYEELKALFSWEVVPIKRIIDVLYEIGFLGFKRERDDAVQFSSFSKGAPGFDHIFHVNVIFFSYLSERAEELGINRKETRYS